MANTEVRYTKKVIKFVCDKISDGLTLSGICRRYHGRSPLIPEERRTLYRWMDRHPDFKEAYLKAKGIQHLVWQDDIKDLADEEAPDTGDAKRDHAVMRQREFKARTMLALSGQLASKYAPELKEKKETGNQIAIEGIQVVNYYLTNDTKPQLSNTKIIEGESIKIELEPHTPPE